MPTRLIATSFALIAFAAAVLSGIVADNPATTILWRALLAMAICYVAGLVIGGIAFQALQEQIERYKQTYPLEAAADESADSGDDGSALTSQDPSEQPQSSASASANRTRSSDSSSQAAAT